MKLKHNTVIDYVGGCRPYLWVGKETKFVTFIDTVRELKQLKRLCEKAIKKLERKRGN